MKDAGLRIRIQKELRDRFVEACRRQDVPAAQVLRDFMRSYVDHSSMDTPQRTPRRTRKSKGRE